MERAAAEFCSTQGEAGGAATEFCSTEGEARRTTAELCSAKGEAGRTFDFYSEATRSGLDDTATKGEGVESGKAG